MIFSWRLHGISLLGARVRVSVTPYGFRDRRNGVWVGFSWISPVSPATNFIPPFLTLISISFHFISSVPVMVRQMWSAGILAIHRPSIWGIIASYPSTRPCRIRIEDLFVIFYAQKSHTKLSSHSLILLHSTFDPVCTFQTLNPSFMTGKQMNFYICLRDIKTNDKF